MLTSLAWLSLLLWQLRPIGTARHALHRKLGLAVLAQGPLLQPATFVVAFASLSAALAATGVLGRPAGQPGLTAKQRA